MLTVIVHAYVVKVTTREKFSTRWATHGSVHKPVGGCCTVVTDELLCFWKCGIETTKRVVKIIGEDENDVRLLCCGCGGEGGE